MRIGKYRTVPVAIMLSLILLTTPPLTKASEESGKRLPSISLNSKSFGADTFFRLGKKYASGDSVEINLEMAEKFFEAAAEIDGRYIKLIANFYFVELRNLERNTYWDFKAMYEGVDDHSFTATKIQCSNFKNEDTKDIRQFVELLAEAASGNLKSYRTAQNFYSKATPETRLLARTRADECLKVSK